MPPGLRPIRFSLAAALLVAPHPAQAAGSPCSTDTFTIQGTVLAVELCTAAGARHAGSKGAAVSLNETFTVKGQPPYVREVPLDVVDDGGASRTIDDVPLGKVGIAKSLHLTIEYRPGSVRLEHALLVPGAVALK